MSFEPLISESPTYFYLGNTTVIAGVPCAPREGGYSDIDPVKMSWPYNVKQLGPHLVFVDAINSAVRVILKDGRVVSLRTNFESTVRYFFSKL